jgi:hypothetical protein
VRPELFPALPSRQSCIPLFKPGSRSKGPHELWKTLFSPVPSRV